MTSLREDGLTASKHRPTLTTLISTTDLDRLEQLHEDEIELPDQPELNSNLFQGEEFDPSRFLLTRRHTPLDELRGELRAYLATLRTSLVGVINEEYEAFIGLSLGLKHANVAQSLATIRKPVLSIRGEVLRVKGELEGMRDEMDGVLEERKRCREVKSNMRRLLATEEAVEKVESLLQLESGQTRGGPGNNSRKMLTDFDESVDSPAKRLERIAAEYNHMLYLVNRAGEHPFIQSLDSRITKTTSALKVDLSQLLTSILTTNSPRQSQSSSSSTSSHETYISELTSTLQTFQSLDLVHEAEEIVRKVVVKPWLMKTIHRNTLSSSTTSTSLQSSTTDPPDTNATTEEEERKSTMTIPEPYRIDPLERPVSFVEHDSGPLLKLYDSILRFIGEECGMILDVAERRIAGSDLRTTTVQSNDLNSSIGALPSRTRRRRRIKIGGIVDDDGAEEEQEQQGDHEEEAEEGKTNNSLDGYQILTRVIVDEIATRLVGELGTTIFAAGRPSVFHQNYLLTTSFLSRIESLCPTLHHLKSLRSYPPYIALMKRFQLPVYFQLRLKETVSSIERSFEVGQASGGGSGIEEGFVMSESECVWEALKRVWKDEVWLEELSPRFWKLTLQIISRYRTWINDKAPRYVVPSPSNNNSSANLSAMATMNGSRSSFDGDRGRLTPTPGSTNRPSTPTLGGGDEASEEVTLRQLTVLIADSRLLERKVNGLFEERIQERLPGDVKDQDGSASEVMRDSLASVTSIVPSLASQITTILIKRCAEHLKLVRSVASQVRASTRKGPSEPSYFVHNILKELKVYLNGPGRVVEEELRIKWATIVVDEIATRYASILSTQKKTEDSLRWLKKGRQGLSFFGRATSSSTDDGSSDDDRVKMQMHLDVETLGYDARELGVDTETSEAFGALRKATVGNDEGKK